MAGNITTAEENRLLDLSLNGTYLALFTTATDDSGAGTEVAGGGYARAAISWHAASGGAKTPSVDIVFPTATSDLGNITHIGIMDSASGGTMRWWGRLENPPGTPSPRLIQIGDTFKMPAININVTLD